MESMKSFLLRGERLNSPYSHRRKISIIDLGNEPEATYSFTEYDIATINSALQSVLASSSPEVIVEMDKETICSLSIGGFFYGHEVAITFFTWGEKVIEIDTAYNIFPLPLSLRQAVEKVLQRFHLTPPPPESAYWWCAIKHQ